MAGISEVVMRPRRAVRALLVVSGIALGAVGLAPASSAVTAPGVGIAPAPEGGVERAFGTDIDGNTFYNAWFVDPPKGRVRHADGSVTPIGRTLSGTGEIGPDGRLWLGEGGALWAYAADGTATSYPVTSPSATSAGPTAVRTGPDGRIWFIDPRGHVGAMATDGTGQVAWPVPGGLGALLHLAPGPDGRMWVSRSKGSFHAVTAAGVVTTYPVFTRQPLGLVGGPAGLYAVTTQGLWRVGGSGRAVAAPVPTVQPTSVDSAVESGGWMWISSDSGLVTSISPSGRLAQFNLQEPYLLNQSFPFPPPETLLAADERGGFVGSPRFVRYADPQVDENLSASGRISTSRGGTVLRTTARGRTPGGTPLTGPVEVELWYSTRVPWGFERERIDKIPLGSTTLSNGQATLDTVITPSIGRRLPSLGDPRGLLNCCWLVVRRPATGGVAGLASPNGSIAGTVFPSSTMLYVDAAKRIATGSYIDRGGLLYWSARLASGTSRTVPVTEFVRSSAWQRLFVKDVYRRWLLRAPTASELSYWSGRLSSDTSSQVELALATKAVARDAGGTSNAQRAAHLANALWLPSSYRSGFQQQLADGVPWSSVVRSAHWSNAGKDARLARLAPRSGFSPSIADLAAEWVRTGDQRGPLIRAIATMPSPASPYDY